MRTVFQRYVISDDTERMAEASRREKEVKAQKLASIASSRSQSASTDAVSAVDHRTEAIEELIAEEDCEVCQSLLAAVAEMDEPKRTRGVAEYGQFKAATEDSEEAAQRVMSDSPVLQEAVQIVQGL